MHDFGTLVFTCWMLTSGKSPVAFQRESLGEEPWVIFHGQVLPGGNYDGIFRLVVLNIFYFSPTINQGLLG